MKLRSTYFLCLVFFMSCNHKDKRVVAKVNVKPANGKITVNVQRANDTLVIPDDTIPKITIPKSTIHVVEGRVDTTFKLKILDDRASYSEQDDVDPKDSKLDWKGIFYNKGNYFIKSTKIKFIKELSEFDDDDKSGQMTGWRLKVIGQDTCLKLIGGLSGLVTGPVKHVSLGNFYYAGQKQEFNYEGVEYTLYTTGTKRNGQIFNCKLYLLANIKGHTFNQLLRSLGNDIILNGGGDSSNSIDLEFVGDIDGDKIPDFIIGGSGFSFGEDYLYLSRLANNDAIVKLVAHFYTSD